MASGRRDALRPRRRPPGKLHDSRIAGLIPGVANHEARQLLDQRVEALRQALARDDEAALGRGLCEAIRLGIWRGRSIQGFDALAEHVVGLPPARARELAEADARARGVELERLPDTLVALWLRAEGALLERCPEGLVEATTDGTSLRLTLELPLANPIRTCETLAAVGRKAQGLGRALEDERARRAQDAGGDPEQTAQPPGEATSGQRAGARESDPEPERDGETTPRRTRHDD